MRKWWILCFTTREMGHKKLGEFSSWIWNFGSYLHFAMFHHNQMGDEKCWCIYSPCFCPTVGNYVGKFVLCTVFLILMIYLLCVKQVGLFQWCLLWNSSNSNGKMYVKLAWEKDPPIDRLCIRLLTSWLAHN